jgi:hypothetical protein
MGYGLLTLTPSAPRTKSPDTEVPSSNLTVAVDGSTSTTRLEVLRTAGVPAPSVEVAWFLRFSCRLTRCARTHGYNVLAVATGMTHCNIRVPKLRVALSGGYQT